MLLVDDGNTAEYAAYLDTLPVQFPGLRILHLLHGGVSAARNAAVSEARGEYILFVDADDIVTKQFWEDAKEIYDRGIEADVIYGMGRTVAAGAFSEPDVEPFSVCELNEEEKRDLYAHFFIGARKRFCTKGRYLGRGSMYRMIRRELVLQCPFDTTLKIGEDIIWNLDILRRKPRVFRTVHLWYVVTDNPNSGTRRYRADLIDVRQKLLRALRPYNTDDTRKDYRMVIYENLEDLAKRYYLPSANPLPWSQKVREFNRLAHSEPFCDIFESTVKEDGIKQYRRMMMCKWGLLLYKYELKKIFSPRKIKNWVKN